MTATCAPRFMTDSPDSQLSESKPPLPLRELGTVTLILMLGLQAMVVQIILIRESLIIFQGNELCFGVVFGAWLAGIAVGANVGARFAPRTRPTTGETVTLLLLLAMAVLPLVQVYLIRIQRIWLNIPPGELAPFSKLLCSSLLTIGPFSALVGLVFPFAFQLFERWKADPPAAIGRLYIIEANGSVLGGVLFTFYIAGRIDAFTSLTLTGLGLCILVLVRAGQKGDEPAGEKLLVASAYLAFLLGALLVSRTMAQKHYQSLMARWQSFNAGLDYVSSVDSRYQNLVLARKAKQLSLYGNGQYLFSFPDEPTYAEEAGRVLIEHPNPKNVLLIGGGAGGLLRQMLLYPVAHIDYVELDPAVIVLVRNYLPPDEREALFDPRVGVHFEDGRHFVKHARQKYDIIFVNLSDPSTAMTNRFYTREFYLEAKAIMNPGGVLATRLSSAVGYLGEEVRLYAASLDRTLRTVFAHVAASPGDTNYFFACDTPDVITLDPLTLMDRFKARRVRPKYFNEYMFPTLLQPELVANLAKQLQAARDIPLNTDFRPITYFYNLMLWDQFTGRQLSTFYRRARSVHLSWVVVLVGALFALRLAYVRLTPHRFAPHQRFNALLVILCAGLAGLSWELILLFAFQNMYGYVYERIGLIIAAFMIGLVIGAGWMNFTLARNSRTEDAQRSILAKLVMAIVVFSLLLPALLWLLSHAGSSARVELRWLEASAIAIMSLTTIAGFLTGAPFPLASRIHSTVSGKPGRAAGLVDSMDHLGACFGALFTGVLLIPLLGIAQTSFTIGLLNASCLALLLLSRPRTPSS